MLRGCLVLLVLAASSDAFLTATTRPTRLSGFLALRASKSSGEPSGAVSRRSLMASGVAAALAAAGAVERVEAEERKEHLIRTLQGAATAAAAEPLTIYGQDAMQLVREGGVTAFGFFIVLAPSILRVTGMLDVSETDKEKYPSRFWTIDSSATGPKVKKDDDVSGGKSL